MKKTLLPLLLLLSGCGASYEEVAQARLLEFLGKLDAFLHGNRLFVQLAEKDYETLKPFLSESLGKEEREKVENTRKMYEPFDLDVAYKVIEAEELDKGNIRVRLTRSYNHRRPSGRIERRTEEEKFILTLEGDLWVILEEWTTCMPCGGTGNCRTCKGSGKSPGADRVCIQCPAQPTKCNQCRGEKVMKSDPLNLTNMTLTFAKEGKTWNESRKTPRDAAESFMDARLRSDDESSKMWAEFVTRFFELVGPYYQSTLVAKSETQWKGARLRARERGLETPKVIAVIEERDGTAKAVVENPMYGTERLRLKKVDGNWLVDAVQVECGVCKAKGGDCTNCRGEGYTSPPRY